MNFTGRPVALASAAGDPDLLGQEVLGAERAADRQRVEVQQVRGHAQGART